MIPDVGRGWVTGFPGFGTQVLDHDAVQGLEQAVQLKAKPFTWLPETFEDYQIKILKLSPIFKFSFRYSNGFTERN